MRNGLLIGLALGVLVVFVVLVTRSPAPKPSPPLPVQPSRPPNVLIITMDTTRADHIGAYGYDLIQTPNIDAMAKEGVLFEEATSVQPVTLPSHSAILTGLYPFHHGVRDNNIYELPEDVTTLAELLKAEGYLTTAFVASYILNHQFGLTQGFDFYNDRFVKPKQRGRLPVDRRASEVSFLACEWLDAVKDTIAQKPFFLWLHYYDPHADYEAPYPYRTAYPNQYDAEIAYMDDWIGYFFGCLRDRGLMDNLIVVMTADHGESLGEHKENTHGIFIYRATTHVPLILRYPQALQQGTRVKDRVSSVDIVPTLLDLLHVRNPVKMDGLSLLPVIAGKKPVDRAIYSEAYIPRGFNWSELEGIREGDWFYIKAPHPELYRIAEEGNPDANLVEKEAEQARTMQDTLAAMTRDSRKAERVTISDEMVERLKAIGYFVGGGENTDETAGGEHLPDPKDKIDLFNVYQRASAMIAKEAYEPGTNLLAKVIEQDSGNPRFLMEDGDALIRIGKYREAEEHLREALSIKPDDARIHYLLGECYETWGKPDQALKEYETTLSLNPKHYLANFHIGMVYVAMERWTEAREAFTKAKTLNPKDPSALNNLGFVAIRADKDFKAGIEFIQQALKLKSDSPEILGSLGSAYLNAGDYANAARYLGMALDMVPDNPVLIKDLKTVYRATGDAQGLERLEQREKLLKTK